MLSLMAAAVNNARVFDGLKMNGCNFPWNRAVLYVLPMSLLWTVNMAIHLFHTNKDSWTYVSASMVVLLLALAVAPYAVIGDSRVGLPMFGTLMSFVLFRIYDIIVECERSR